MDSLFDSLIYLPANVGSLVVLGDRLLGEWVAVDMRLLTARSCRVVKDHATIAVTVVRRAWVVHGCAHPDDTVWIGGSKDGLAIHIRH